METRTQSWWISRLLEGYGHEVLVAQDLQGISLSDRKNDRNDAEKLARYARLDRRLLNPIQHRSEQTANRPMRHSARNALVRARTLLVNNARGLARNTRRAAAAVHHGHVWKTRTESAERQRRVALEPLLSQIDQLSVQLAGCDAKIEQISRTRYPRETKVLCSVPGVGPLAASTYVLTLSDAQRFTHSRDVGPIRDCSRSSSNRAGAIRTLGKNRSFGNGLTPGGARCPLLAS